MFSLLVSPSSIAHPMNSTSHSPRCTHGFFAPMCLVLTLAVLWPDASISAEDADWSQIPFERREVADSLGRTVQYYVSKDAQGDRLPVVLLIQGSGCQSIFQLRGGRINGSY